MKKFYKTLVSMLIMVVMLTSVVLASVDYKELAANKYKDVKKTDWFAEYVGKLTELNIINGYNGAFDPSGYMTRAEFVKMIVQAMGYRHIDAVSFDDLKPFPTSKPHWACVYIETALRTSVISKDEIGNNFFPDVPLTRKDMGMMIYRALKLTPSEGANPFADLTEADGYLTKLYEEYLIRGNIEGGKVLYKPEGLTTRAEAAVIIARMVEYKENPKGYVAKMGKLENINMPEDIYNKLNADKKNLNGKTMEQANKELINSEATAYYAKQYKCSPEELIEHVVKMAHDYVIADWNIDYRTVEKTYAEKVRDIIPKNHYMDISNIIKYYKDNKLIQEAIFYTNRDLVYGSDGRYFVRGNVIFRFQEPTTTYFLTRLQERDNKNILSLGQWYSEDIEVRIAGDPGSTENILRAFRVNILNQPKPIKR